MIFTLHRLLQFPLDIGLVIWLFRPLPKHSRRQGFITSCLPFLLLLALALLYFYDDLNGVNLPFVFRFLYRSGIYTLFLFLGKDMLWQTAAFCGNVVAFIFTCCQNIFFSPILFSISRGIYSFTNYHILNELFCFLIQATVYILVFFLVQKIFPIHSSHIPEWVEWMTLLLLLICELYVKESLRLVNTTEESVLFQFSYFSIILNLIILALLVFFEQYIYSTRRWHEIQIQDVQNKYYLKNLEYRREGSESVANLHHDMKNHLIALRSIAQKEDNSQIDEYIRKLLDETVPFEDVVETGKPVLDGLLSEKVDFAQKEQIGTDIRLDFSKIDFLDDMTLCTIFGNAMDNAIEACQRIPPEEGRLIQVKSELGAGHLILYFINSSPAPVTTVNGLPTTTKKDKQRHGMGLKNISRAINKYGGTMHIKSNETRFELIIMIPTE